MTLTSSRSSHVTVKGSGVDDDYDSEDGFTRVTGRRRSNEMHITDRKTGTVLQSVPPFRKFQVFLSNAIKNFVNELINDECDFEQLRTRYSSYSSFLISCK